MLSAVDDKLIINALDLRKKIDTALEMGIPAESIGAALMLEKGLDPGNNSINIPHSLDALIYSVK